MVHSKDARPPLKGTQHRETLLGCTDSDAIVCLSLLLHKNKLCVAVVGIISSSVKGSLAFPRLALETLHESERVWGKRD